MSLRSFADESTTMSELLLVSETRSTAGGCLGQFNQHSPAKARLHPCEWTSRPWQLIHVDFAEYSERTYIIVDAYLKWFDVIQTSDSKREHTIQELRKIFCNSRLARLLCIGPAFTSEEFALFMTKWEQIHHCSSVSPIQ